MHYGQDMAAPAGTPVSAMQGGRVTAVSRMGDVTVTHADGSTKTYRHIDPSGLKVGQEIEGGAQIGTLRARDPRSTGPHLHLEATDAQGRRYDPRAEIDGAGKADAGMAEAQGPRRPDDITRSTPGYVEGRDAKPRRWVQDRETQKWRPDFLSDGSDNREPAGAADQLRERRRQEEMLGQREASARSPRYRDPAGYQLKAGVGAGDLMGAGGAGRSGSSGASVVQNFHGGFDAHEVGRRAQLEQNREVRRTMAGALHDVGHPVSV